MIGKLKDMFRSRDGGWVISFTTQTDFSEAFDELFKHDVDIEIKKAFKKRSLTANAFAWVLLDQIAAKTGRKVSDIYRSEIREVGGVSTMVGMKDEAIPTFKRNWENGHLGRQVEVVPGSQKAGWSNVKIYFGSSEFDTSQMQRFIQNIIQDAEALGIPTISEKEYQKMIANWDKKQKETRAEK